VLWASHLIDEAASGDDVVILHRGRVLVQGPIDEIVARSSERNLAGVFGLLTQDSDADDTGAAA
jgi:ABC-2 type transport system ATP-binding protein